MSDIGTTKRKLGFKRAFRYVVRYRILGIEPKKRPQHSFLAAAAAHFMVKQVMEKNKNLPWIPKVRL